MFAGHTNDGFGPGILGHELTDERNKLAYIPAATHLKNGKLIEPKRAVQYDPNSGSDDQSGGGKSGSSVVSYIDEVEKTYGYLTGSYGIINEHQLMCSECTDFARMKADYSPGKRIFYSSELSNIALERCSGARQAIETVGELIDEHGIYGTGETLIFADTKEAWALEMCSRTLDGCKDLWVAKRVPDGEVFAASNTFDHRPGSRSLWQSLPR
jgi:dipeptidase